MNKYTKLTPDDNVAVALSPLSKGETVDLDGGVVLAEDVPAGHKFALRAIASGENVIKYGVPIGHAQKAIAPGEWVHVHNVKTNLSGEVEYRFEPSPDQTAKSGDMPTFMGYPRAGGKVGIRNEIWIIPTVGCVNSLAVHLAEKATPLLPPDVGPAVAFPHPHGCSQLGEDHENTRRILANLALHPNAGGILFVGLGCENNTIGEFRKLVESHPDHNPNIKYMVAQEEDNEFAAGLSLISALAAKAALVSRESTPVSALRVGLKCGGSDGLSGITANPLIGAFSDWLVDRGGSTVLTEVPEMFGAEKSLLNRAINSEVFQRGVDMINNFKKYFKRYGQTIYENPSPGNKDGGITTLEDKSLGCTQKGGSRPVVDVLPYGGVLRRPGVTILAGPGNDIVTVSALSAAGAHMVLFSTGRGTPLGGPAPVIKISTNADLAKRKKGWIDFDASPIASGESREAVLDRFVELLLDIASGQETRSERHNCHDFAIFKDGVTL